MKLFYYKSDFWANLGLQSFISNFLKKTSPTLPKKLLIKNEGFLL